MIIESGALHFHVLHPSFKFQCSDPPGGVNSRPVLRSLTCLSEFSHSGLIRASVAGLTDDLGVHP